MPENSAPILHPNESRAPYPIRIPPMAAARNEGNGILALGANLPASAAARPAPRMMPKFITEVLSARTELVSAWAWAGHVQNSQLATGMPTASAALAPHRPNP